MIKIRLAFIPAIAAIAAIACGLVVLQPTMAKGTPLSTAVGATPRPQTVAVPGVADFSLADAITYTDCTGSTPLAPTAIYRDVCLSGIYLVGHNPGPLTPILKLEVGARVSYHNHLYAITSKAIRTTAAQWNEAQRHPADLTIQTCANDELSRVWVFTASAL